MELSQFYMNSGPYAHMKAFTTEPSPCPQLFLISTKRFCYAYESVGMYARLVTVEARGGWIP